MHHEYDLFEKFPDGSSLWRACVVGLENTRHYLVDLAQRSPNRFYAVHLKSGKILVLEHQQGPLDNERLGGRGKATAA